MIATTQHTPGRDARFYIGRIDTRWHVYPAQEPEVVVAHDWRGFYGRTASGEWFKSPVSYILVREITKAEAEGGAK